MAPSSRNKPSKPVAKAKAASATKKAVAKPAPKPVAKPAASGIAKPVAKPLKKPAPKVAAKPAAKMNSAKAPKSKPAPKAPPTKPRSASTAKSSPATKSPTTKPAAAKSAATNSLAAKPKPAPAKPTQAPSSKATLPPVTKSKAPEAKSPPKLAPEKVSAPTRAEMPAAALPAAPVIVPGPRPSIIVAAPPNMPIRNSGNPMSPRPPMGRPNMPPSFAVRSPGRPGFAEGQPTPPRPPGPKVEFKAGDHVVYPTHGVGTVQGIEVIEVAGTDHHMIVVTFDENRMTLRVPVNKVPTAGLRKLFTQKEFDAAIDTLKGRARIKRTMWSRRAQEYEAKINSGDPIQIAEVVRDLQRNAGQPDQSFSERQIYEQALERLAAEYAAIEKIDKLAASDQLVVFAKST